jgi:hypothetical protein
VSTESDNHVRDGGGEGDADNEGRFKETGSFFDGENDTALK